MLSDQNLDPCLFHGEGEAVLPATGLDLVGLLFSAVVHFLLQSAHTRTLSQIQIKNPRKETTKIEDKNSKSSITELSYPHTAASLTVPVITEKLIVPYGTGI